MRIHDQLHSQTQTPAGEVHDEQRAGELHHPTGTHKNQGYAVLTHICVRVLVCVI